jgi:hypothetical protein
MRKPASGVAVAVAVLFASLVRAQAPAPAPGAPRTREVDPGVFNSSPVIDRADLRAETISAIPGQVYFINHGTPHGFNNATQSTATAIEVFIK